MAVSMEAQFENECKATWISVLNSLQSKLTRRQDFLAMLQQAGRNPSRKTVEKYWTERRQSMEFQEFCDILRFEKPQTTEDLTSAFRKIDINNDGYITHNELKRVLTKHGEKMSDEEVSRIFSEADVNHDGKLDYQEFCQMVMTTSKRCQSNSLKKLAKQEKHKSQKEEAKSETDRKTEATSSREKKEAKKQNKQMKREEQKGFDEEYLQQSDDENASASLAKNGKSKTSDVSNSKATPTSSPQRLTKSSHSTSHKPEKVNQTPEGKPFMFTKNENARSPPALSPPAVSVEEFVVSEGNDTDEDDLVVFGPSANMHLSSRSETVIAAGGSTSAAAGVDKLKSKSSVLLTKKEKELVVDLSAPGSRSTRVSKGKKVRVKEPKNLKSWHKAHGKGCFYFSNSNIVTHRYQLELPSASNTYITVNPPTIDVPGKPPVDITLLLIEKAGDDVGAKVELFDFTETYKSKKSSLRTELRAGTYCILPFTTGCRFKRRASESTEEKKLLDEAGDFTLDARHALDEMFNRADLDQDGKLSRKEFNYFQNQTSGEECDDETWEIIKENFEVTQQDKLMRKGFHDLHKETVKDEDGGISELWGTLQAMGYNKALQLDEAWPFEFDVHCEVCQPELSVSGYETEDRQLEEAVVASVTYHSDRIPVKGHNGLIVHEFRGDSRVTVAVENVGSEVTSVTFDCTGSGNCVSHRGSLKHTLTVLPQETQIVHHLMADNWKKSCKPKWTVVV